MSTTMTVAQISKPGGDWELVERAIPEPGRDPFAPDAANLLLRYPWPGNVRELENALERALALARSDRIGVDDLPPEVGAAPPTVQTADDVRTLAEVERDYIAAALRASGGNRAKAAEKLGIGAATLYRKIKQARK